MGNNNSVGLTSLPYRLVPWAGLALLLADMVLVFTGGPVDAVVVMLYVAARMLGVTVEPPAMS